MSDGARAVAVVGLGAMGSRIAERLLVSGYDVFVWNRSRGRIAALVAAGGCATATPAEAARRSTTLITMLSDADALEAVTEGDDGIAAGAHPDLTVVEMSTVGPHAIASLSSAVGHAKGLLDAPVLGSLAEAESGTLTIFVGGEAELVEQTRPLLSVLGSVSHVGTSGAGAAAKLVANAALLSALVTLGEAVELGRRLGLNRQALADVLRVTPLGAQADRRLQAIENGTYPPRFSLSLARKDADLISVVARAGGPPLRVVESARRWLIDAQAAGHSDQDYTAVLATIVGNDGVSGRPDLHGSHPLE